MRMNGKDLLGLVRELAADKTSPPQWSDAFLLQALNDAEWEACRRARLIIDSSTPKVCKVTLRDGISEYPLDPTVIFIRRVKLSSRGQPLGFARVRDMDLFCEDWETETGEIVGWVNDYTTGKLRTYRIPTATEAGGVITLTVVRGPLKCIEASETSFPEIHQRFHYNMVHWALFRMYSVQDSETRDPKKAAENLALFENEFGPASPAIEEQWIDRNFDYAQDQGVL